MENNASTTVKFLMPYSPVRYFTGYDQAVSFIYQDDDGTVSLGRNSQYYNSSGVSQGTSANTIDDTDFTENVGITKLYRYSGSVDTVAGGYFEIWIDEVATGQISEKLRFNIDDSTGCRNPFFVAWLNPLGGHSYWLFDVKQEFRGNLDVTTYQPAIDDIATVRATRNQLTAKETNTVTLIADGLTWEEFQHLQTLPRSRSIWWYEDGTAATRKQIIPLSGSTIEYTNDDGLYGFEWEFELPEVFMQSN